MKFLKIASFVIFVLVLLVLVLALLAPKDYFVERSIIINAPVEVVFDHVKYWKNWSAWSPWAERDSTMTVTVKGVDGTVGSKYVWVGDKNVTGSGEMTNTGITENEIINYNLHFLVPWESESEGYLKVNKVDGKTQASWGFYGNLKFPMNIFMLFQSMEKMMSPDFDRGLTLLKKVAEKEALAINSYEINVIDFSEHKYIAVTQKLAMNELKDFFQKSFTELYNKASAANAGIVGPPAALYYTWDDAAEVSKVAAALPVRFPQRVKDVEKIELPTSRAAQLDHVGAYDEIAPAYKALEMYVAKNEMTLLMPVVEEYVSDASQQKDPEKLLTKIYFLVQ